MHRRSLTIAVVTMLICVMMTIPANAACSGAATVNGSSVNFRSGASTNSAVKAVTYDGAPVVVEAKASSDWYKVIYKGSEGYIAAQYLNRVNSISASFGTAYINGTGVRLRSGPSTSSKILGTYNTGASMSVTGVSGSWYKVTLSGVAGYVCGDYVTFTKPAAVAKVSVGQQIATSALQYVGYPYVYGGSSPSGFDCSGFVKYVYSLYGYSLDRTAAQQSQNGTQVAAANMQPGDIICFASGGYVGHVGIYIGDGKFVHACNSSTGVIVTELSSASYSGRVASIRRVA